MTKALLQQLFHIPLSEMFGEPLHEYLRGVQNLLGLIDPVFAVNVHGRVPPSLLNQQKIAGEITIERFIALPFAGLVFVFLCNAAGYLVEV
jgi:hypothetical protein